VGLDHVETSCTEFLAQFSHRPLVCIKHGVVELLDSRALEEAEEEPAAWPKDASKLGQGDLNGAWLVMNE